MIDESIITEFIPAKSIEAPLNTYPEARLSDKLKLAMRRYMSNESFEDGEISEDTPKLLIKNYYFDPKQMGYNVIARII